MRTLAALMAVGLTLAPAAAQIAPAPLDRSVERQPDGLSWLVLRYLVPDLPTLGFGIAAPELDRLCAVDGVPAAMAEDLGHVLIVLMDRAVPRGQPDPDATQFIGAYRVEAGECRAE